MGILLGRVGRRRGRRGFERGGFEGGCSCYYFDIPGHMGGGVEILLLDYALFRCSAYQSHVVASGGYSPSDVCSCCFDNAQRIYKIIDICSEANGLAMRGWEKDIGDHTEVLNICFDSI